VSSASSDTAVEQIRHSSVLLLGRVVSLAVNLLLQLALAWYLEKSQFGAFAVAWAAVDAGAFCVALGLNKAIARYAPVYFEATMATPVPASKAEPGHAEPAHAVNRDSDLALNRDRCRLMGRQRQARRAVAQALAVVVALGAAFVAAVFAAAPWLAGREWLDPLTMRLLLTMAFLAPLDALSYVFQDLFVAFGEIRAVFFRRYVLAPLLRIAAVGAAIAWGWDVERLAIAYVAGGAIGLVPYAWQFRTVWRSRMRGLETDDRPRAFPASSMGPAADGEPRLGELLRFGMAVFASQMGALFRWSAIVFLLQVFKDNEQVGDYRAVLPFARLNQLVMENFTVAFVPAATRLIARGSAGGMGRLVDLSSVWVAVFTLPCFLATCALAPLATAWLLGPKYAAAWPVMSVLSAGFLVESLFGFAPLVMRAYARFKPAFVADGAALVATAALVPILIPRYGAVGAAWSVVAGILVSCAILMLAVRRFNRDACRWSTPLRLAATLGVAAAAVGWLSMTKVAPPAAQLVAAIAACVGVSWFFRKELTMDDIFPELQRIPWLGSRLRGAQAAPRAVLKAAPKVEPHAEQKVEPQAAPSDGLPGGLSPPRGPVAYMMSRFPKITETFVLFEMQAMEREGVRIEVYPLLRARNTGTHPEGAGLWGKFIELLRAPAREAAMHPEAKPFVERAHYSPLLSLSILAANLASLFTHPIRYLHALGALVLDNLGSWNYLLGGLVLFPKTVAAARDMRRRGISHIHAHFGNHPAAMAWVAHRLTGIPYSFTAHGADIQVDQHMLRRKVQDASFVVTISDYNVRFLVDHCGETARSRIRVIRCGVDTNIFRPAEQRSDDLSESSVTEPRSETASMTAASSVAQPCPPTGSPSNSSTSSPTSPPRIPRPLRMVCVGTFYEVKGHQYLIEACRLLRDRGIEFTCSLVGDGPLGEQLRKLAGELGVADSVRFLGRRTRDEIAELLRHSDVLVAPSIPTDSGRREGIPVVLMEAMASGLAVVGSDISGIPELVEDRVNGRLCPPRDPESLATALAELLDDPQRLESWGRAARRKVLREYHLPTNARRLIALFASATESQSC
jgi:glycosyltransferase involved in cell wall biosynthesis/O-antigen/teichoic acid export membrane protein